MSKQQNKRKIPHTTNKGTYVSASYVAKRYDVTSRYILKLAAEGTIPSLRIGKKCVRFDMEAVSKALEGEN